MRKVLEGKIGELEEESLYIGGDFNARIDEEGKKWNEEEEREIKRNSKDKIINNEEKEMLRMVKDRG